MSVLRIDQQFRWVSDNGVSVTLAPELPISCDDVEGIDGLESEIYTDKSAGQDGLNVVGMSLKERNITLTGSIHAREVDNRALLLWAFSPKDKGTLHYVDATRAYSIRAAIESAPKFSRDDTGELAFFVSLLCPVPYWEDAQGETHYMLAAWSGGAYFPFEIDDSKGIAFEERQDSVIQLVHNAGQVPAGLRIIFTASGAVENPEVMHMGTRVKTALDTTMQAGDSIIVDSRYGKKGVYYQQGGIATPAPLYLMSGDFITLGLGDNAMRYAAQSGVDALNIELVFTPYFLGV